MNTQTYTIQPKQDYYIDPNIKQLLLASKEMVLHKDWDRVYIIDGEEGSGKSLLGLQLGKFLDRSLNIERVVFNADDFVKAIKQAKKNQCIIFDEAFNGLDSSSSLSTMNKLLVRTLMECRQKNLFIIIILPSFFMLNKYAAIHRSRCLFHVYALPNGTRGYYKVYGKKNKRLLYIYGKQLMSYFKPYIPHSYRFYGKYPIDEQQYRKKKLDSLEVDEKLSNREMMDRIRLSVLFNLLKIKFNIPFTEVEAIFKANKCTLDHSNIGKIAEKTKEIVVFK